MSRRDHLKGIGIHNTSSDGSQPTHRKFIFGIVLASFVSGCGFVNTDSPFWATVRSVGSLDAVSPVDRAHVEALPYASMLAWFDEAPRAFLVLAEANDDRLMWLTADRIAVVTQNGYLIQTGGLDPDVQLDFPQRTVVPAPTTLLGLTLDRTYSVRSRRLIDLPATGRFVSRGLETVTIVEREMTLLRVEEELQGVDEEPVRNTYWVDPETGFIWKSRQFAGPGLPHLNIEILKPFGA